MVDISMGIRTRSRPRGIPHIVTPFITADQSFWESRVYAVGAGPKPILVKNLTGGEPNTCDGRCRQWDDASTCPDSWPTDPKRKWNRSNDKMDWKIF